MPKRKPRSVKPETIRANLMKFDAHYCGVEVEYDWLDRDEERHEMCDSICRCSVIRNPKIESVDVDAILKGIAKVAHVKPEDTIKMYGLDRLISICELWREEHWYVNVGNGYYGEEIRSVDLESELFVDQVMELLSLPDDRVLEFLLKAEYGHVLEGLNPSFWTIESVNPKDIVIGNKDHYHRLDVSVVEAYSSRMEGSTSLPIAICRYEPSADKWVVVDGHHRVAALKKTKRRKVNIIGIRNPS